MSYVIKLGITNINNKKIKEVTSIKVLKDKGIIGENFNEYNDPYCQLSLIGLKISIFIIQNLD